jgi:hypothetical protein
MCNKVPGGAIAAPVHSGLPTACFSFALRGGPHRVSAMISDTAETYAAVRAARSPEYNRRCAAHEAGHAIVGRALGSVIELVTIVPDGEYAGKCVRRGAPSRSLNLLDLQKVREQTPTALTTMDILDICAKIGAPEVGTPRVDLAEEITRSQTNIIECLAGTVGERMMLPDLPPLPAEHDRIEARALASVICASPLAVDSLLTYGEAEAEALIRDNHDIVAALTDALIAEGTLSGGEVDAIIVAGVARRSLAAEHERRRVWAGVIANANSFQAEQHHG